MRDDLQITGSVGISRVWLEMDGEWPMIMVAVPASCEVPPAFVAEIDFIGPMTFVRKRVAAAETIYSLTAIIGDHRMVGGHNLPICIIRPEVPAAA